MEVDSRWQPALRTKDRWYDSPILGIACWASVLLFFWWGKDSEAARLGQVVFPTALFLMWWVGRDRQLSKRIEVLADAVQGLQAATQAVLQSSTHEDPREP